MDVKTLHAKIGELTLANDFLDGALGKAGRAERKAMIDRSHALPLTRQAEVLGISRGSLYYQPRAGAQRPIWPSCGGWMNCIWRTRLRAAGCCATCCWRRASRSGACMSPR